jgi:hypothetical protein
VTPQAKYNRDVRTDPLIRKLQNARQRELRAAARLELITTELQCWIWQLEFSEFSDENSMDN